MNLSLRRTFRLFLLSLPVVFSGGLPVAHAQQFKVEKVKGGKAIIEVMSGDLTPGKTYTFGGTESPEEVATVAGPRKHLIGGSIDFQSFTFTTTTVSGSSSSSKLIQILTRYGWNLASYEAGFILEYVNREPVSSSNSFVKGGLFFDYNFTPNVPGENSIFGAGTEITYGTFTSAAGGNTTKAFLSGFWKWFVFGPSTALRLDLGYSYEANNFDTFKTTNQGLALRGGLSTYF